MRFEFTSASTRSYCGSSGNSSLPGKRITIQNKLMHLHAIHSEAEEMAETFSVSQYNNVLNSEYLLQVYQLWSQYLENLRHENSKLSAFWVSYIHLVGDVLLGLIRASREGNLLLHLYAVHHMIPWCFAYDKFNYA